MKYLILLIILLVLLTGCILNNNTSAPTTNEIEFVSDKATTAPIEVAATDRKSVV